MNRRIRGRSPRGSLPAEVVIPISVAVPPAIVSDVSVHRLSSVIERLTTPFSTAEILDHAIGIGAIRHCDEIGPILERLTETGVIVVAHSGAAMWTSTWSAVP